MQQMALSLIPLGLAYIMFTLGLSLEPKDFAIIIQKPKAFFVGLAHQLLLVPLVAFCLVWLIKPTPEIGFGILLLSFCPGGVTSSLFSLYAKANVALSVALTATVSLLCMITMPVLIKSAYGYFFTAQSGFISITKLALTVFLLTTLPVAIGMVLRRVYAQTVLAWQPRLQHFASLVFACIVLAAVAANFGALKAQAAHIGMVLILMLILLFLLGLSVSHLVGLTWQNSKTIAIETGVQNGAAAIALAPIIASSISTHSASSIMATSGALSLALPATLYSVLMNLVVIPFIIWFRTKP